MNIKKRFSNFARYVAHVSGQPYAFVLACMIVFVWLVVGPFFSFSDTWQLVINTGTTIVTFLMVFLIQNTQNRDGEAIQIKLDELIRAHQGAHNAFLDLEELTEEQLCQIKKKYEKLARKARGELKQGKEDTEANEV
ncbi:MAG: low affinity iron permease family protein [Alphaproteobacteria bacterium]|nr:low affinity iron permease family protein [Alphaproteobacteria bacterium]